MSLQRPEAPSPTRPPKSVRPRTKRVRVELSSPQVLEPLLAFLETPEVVPAVRETVHKLLKRHVRITHPANLPPPSPDPDLAARVAALEEEAAALSARISQTREAALASLQKTLSVRVADALQPPSPPSPAPVRPPKHAALAKAAQESASALPARFAKAREDAERTRRRAAAVKDVLRLIAQNVQPDPTVAEEWTATFSDLPQKRPAEEATPSGEITGAADFEPVRSPVPVTASGSPVYCAISPHVTPRSKLRKRIARSAERHGSMRQPSFGTADLPR